MYRRISGNGFTLLEVLVALAIISIALLAALRAAGSGMNNLEELRSRTLANWVAQNLLAEHRARGDWLPVGTRSGTARQAGIEFSWRENVTQLPRATFRRVDIIVFSAPGQSRPAARISGIVVQPR